MRKLPRQRLGESLEARGLITREQLLRALRNQKVLGGRVGTCLLEIDALSEQDLSTVIGEQSGSACVTPEELRGIPDDVIRLIPAKVAKRCMAIPFHASSTQVKVALANVSDLTIQDEVAFVVGRRVRWYLALELRIQEALATYYGEECPQRFSKLLDRLNRARYLWGREGPAPAGATPPAEEMLQWDPGVVAAHPRASAEPISRELELPTFSTEPAPPAVSPPRPEPAPAPPGPAASSPPAGAAPALGAVELPESAPEPARPPDPPSPMTLAQAERRLLDPQDRDDVAQTLIEFAGTRGRRAILFVQRRGETAAWRWTGDGLDADRLAAFRARTHQPSVFVSLRDSDGVFRGALPPMPVHLTLSACFEPPLADREVAVLPVRLRDRLVAALLVEPAARGFSAETISELHRLLAKAAIAFELCIMRNKLRDA